MNTGNSSALNNSYCNPTAYDVRPEFSLSTTPRYDSTGYQNERLTNYAPMSKSPRYSKPLPYQPAGVQQIMKASQSSSNIPSIVPPIDDINRRSFVQIPTSNQSGAPNSGRRDYNPKVARGNMNKVQNEYYQRSTNVNPDVGNSTLRQSLNLLKMATNMNQRRPSGANYGSMNNGAGQVPLMDPRQMQRQYARPQQNPVQNYGRYVPMQNMNMPPGPGYVHPMQQNFGSFNSQNTMPTPEKVALNIDYQSPEFTRGKL